MNTRYPLLFLIAIYLFSCTAKDDDRSSNKSTISNAVTLNVDLDQKIADIQPTMWGLFFEDINFAADGGVYAECIKNYSFEFQKPLMGWRRVQEQEAKGYCYIKAHPSGVNKTYLQMQRLNDEGVFGMQNHGFRGIGIKEGNDYNISFTGRKQSGENLTVRIQLLDSDHNVVGESEINGFGANWKEYKMSVTSSVTDPKGTFRILVEGEGVLDIDLVSMFPEDTWKNRDRGLRKDLVQLLADLDPGFLRFPGGCIVEGFDLENRYKWKNTIGSMASREVMINRWNFEFTHRATPDYYQSFGLGFFEYFQLAEDLEAEPLPILSCGLACQYNSGEIVPMGELAPYIQDALDLIEFANGPASSVWGAKRAEMGHPEPFNMKYIGIGNEQWGPQYIERAKAFQKAIKAKYPDITIISTSGPSPDGAEYEYLWEELRKMDAEIVDEHYYRPPDWFLENARRYDDFDRNGPKVFAGEFAAHSQTIDNPEHKNSWGCALAEAAFMTGLERNADIVHMASYAPLFANIDAWQWSPDLIWFDNLRSMGTPNYYVQKLFSTNKGTTLISVTKDGHSLAGENELYASATIDENINEAIIKIVNTDTVARKINLVFDGKSNLKPMGKLTFMANDDLKTINTLDDPLKISPLHEDLQTAENEIDLEIKGNSLNVIKVGLTK